MSQNKALEMIFDPCTNRFVWSGLFRPYFVEWSIDGVNFQQYKEIGNDIPVEVEMERCKNDSMYFFKHWIIVK